MLALLLLLSLFQPHTIVISADPLLYDAVVVGAQAWTDTGIINFSVVVGECNEGHFAFCLKEGQGSDPSYVAVYKFPGRVVEVYNLSLFNAAFACQELGHILGLHYHRSDYQSCMTNPLPTVAAPDSIDLANLGFTVPSVPVPSVAEPTDAPSTVTTLPNTGTGTCYLLGDNCGVGV